MNISKVSSLYYGNKVLIVYLHKPILYWSFSNSHLSVHLAEKAYSCKSQWQLPLTWCVAKYGKCSGTLAYLSNIGSKNKAWVYTENSNSP